MFSNLVDVRITEVTKPDGSNSGLGRQALIY